MPNVTIDNQAIEVEDGATILDAARQAGIAIPTLCHRDGCTPLTSCFVCVVKVNGGSRLLPACATKVADEMAVESETDEVHAARRAALELLLSDHLGDCVGPCQMVCPAHMEIPAMIRQIAAGELREAIITIKRDIALPATLGRICPELCERGCRRAQTDGSLSICLLKRHAADVDLGSETPYQPACLPSSGKRVAIIGAGPAGLSAAYYLQQAGHQCVVFDAHERAGGALRTVAEALLPCGVLDAEIDLIRALGVEFRLNEQIALTDLQRDFDAVLIAAGAMTAEKAAELGIEMGPHGIHIDKHTYLTEQAGVFAAGSAVTPVKHAIQALAEGKFAAHAIAMYLATGHVAHVEHRPYSVHIGRMQPDELALLLERASEILRVNPAAGGFSPDEAVQEAERCLHCDCRKLHTCKLREYAIEHEASVGKYGGERRRFSWDITHPHVIYEPGKCISCGICIQIAEAALEELGLSFIGRGFAVRVAVPFNETLSAGLQRVAREYVAACPVAALAAKEECDE